MKLIISSFSVHFTLWSILYITGGVKIWFSDVESNMFSLDLKNCSLTWSLRWVYEIFEKNSFIGVSSLFYKLADACSHDGIQRSFGFCLRKGRI